MTNGSTYVSRSSEHSQSGAPPAQGRSPGGRRTPQGILLLGLLIAGLAVSLFHRPDEVRRYHADARLETTGDWQEMEVHGRFSEGVATFTTRIGDTARLELGDQERIGTVRLLLRTYQPGGRTRLAVRIGDATRELVYGHEPEGMHFHDVRFDPPVAGDVVEITVTELQQAAVVLDGIETISLPGDFDVLRLATILALLGLVALGLELARRFTIAPQASGGRTYRSIDLLRGVGAGLVVLVHARGYSAKLEPGTWPWLDALAHHGHFRVELFYVLSAYTLTFSLASAHRRRSDAIIQTFWWRRIARIAPAFYLTFFGCLLMSALFGIPPTRVDSKNAEEVFATWLTMSYVFDPTILKAPISHSVWWSVSTEFQFYVVMPLLGLPLLAAFRRLRLDAFFARCTVALGVAAIGITLAIGSRRLFAGEAWLQYSLFQHLDAFGMGAAAALPFALRSSRPLPTGGHPVVGNALAAVTLALLFAVVAGSTSLDARLLLPAVFAPRRVVILLTCCLAVLLLRTVEARGGLGEKVLPGLRALGLLSFAVYLLHVPAMQFVTLLPVPTTIGSFHATWLWTSCLAGFLSLLGALALHRMVEMPALAWSRSPARGRGARIGSAVYMTVVAIAVVVGILRN